jgi:hypothetical protein
MNSLILKVTQWWWMWLVTYFFLQGWLPNAVAEDGSPSILQDFVFLQRGTSQARLNGGVSAEVYSSGLYILESTRIPNEDGTNGILVDGGEPCAVPHNNTNLSEHVPCIALLRYNLTTVQYCHVKNAIATLMHNSTFNLTGAIIWQTTKEALTFSLQGDTIDIPVYIVEDNIGQRLNEALNRAANSKGEYFSTNTIWDWQVRVILYPISQNLPNVW